MAVTSPPYWSLRDYGVEPTVWGGEGGCEHQDFPFWVGKGSPICWQDDICQRCGAWRGALGLEPTPALYVAHMVEVFREVRRALRPDATLWLNIGDSYSSGGRGTTIVQTIRGDSDPEKNTAVRPPANLPGLKPKDLVGIPWMLAFALRDDGWWLRQDIVWSKPNVMPESVTDRCTKAHEYLFLLTKSERYYYDQDAIREPIVRQWDETNGGSWAHKERQPSESKAGNHNGSYPLPDPRGANKRSVWTIPTTPFIDKHFATFPPKLVEPCILAGSSRDDIVLDPFLGTGTTAIVARQHGRRAIGIDVGEKYLRMARRRIAAKKYYVAAPEPSSDNPFAIALEYDHGSSTQNV